MYFSHPFPTRAFSVAANPGHLLHDVRLRDLSMDVQTKLCWLLCQADLEAEATFVVRASRHLGQEVGLMKGKGAELGTLAGAESACPLAAGRRKCPLGPLGNSVSRGLPAESQNPPGGGLGMGLAGAVVLLVSLYSVTLVS